MQTKVPNRLKSMFFDELSSDSNFSRINTARNKKIKPELDVKGCNRIGYSDRGRKRRHHLNI